MIVKKLVIIFIGIFLSFIFIEISLRVGNIIYNFIYKVPQYKNFSDIGIFCVGESTTWGIGASDPLKKGYPKQLEKMLNERFPNKKIHCFFDQTIGQNTSEILEKLPTYIKKYQPHLIIFMVGVNNWWNLDKSNILLFNKNKFISESTLKTLVFLDRFRVWKLFKWIVYSLGLKKERWNYWGSDDRREVDELMEKLINKYNFNIFMEIAEHDMTEMMKICKANHIKVIICSYPNVGGELYYIQKGIAQKFKLLFVDNFELFKRLSNREEYYAKNVSFGHPNDKGYRIVAENIFKCILENKLIE